MNMVVRKNRKWRVAVLPGDGIGPEIIEVVIPIIEVVNSRFGISMDIVKGRAGFDCIKEYGSNLPEETIELLRKSDCVIKGPMTTPEGVGSEMSAAVKIRKMFDLYANVRPAKSMPGVKGLRDDIDLVIVRENTEGLYSGIDFKIGDGAAASMMVITRKASERIGRFAFELAGKRKRHVTIVHKGNILKISNALLKDSIEKVGKRYRGFVVDDAHVDAMAQWLIKNPQDYDVIVTENLFGDILSDEAAMVVGGIGTGPSANIGDKYAMFEPIHGSAPKYKGQDKVNPVGMIMAAKMMYDWMGYPEAGKAIEDAVERSIRKGYKTYDIGGKKRCSEVGREIKKEIEERR